MKVESSFHKSPKNALKYHWLNSGILFLIELIIIVALFSMWRYLIGTTYCLHTYLLSLHFGYSFTITSPLLIINIVFIGLMIEMSKLKDFYL